jgi:hypothetical protein
MHPGTGFFTSSRPRVQRGGSRISTSGKNGPKNREEMGRKREQKGAELSWKMTALNAATFEILAAGPRSICGPQATESRIPV